MKIKVIDLLNKMANGEEIKAKLKFNLGDIIITYYGKDNYYHTPEYNIEYIDKGCTTHDFTLGMLIKSLNDEVEILEEDKKIPEKLNYVHPDISCSYNESELLLRIEANKDKINSIIDYLKSKGDK